MKSKRPKLILRKGIALAALALPAAGCANTPEEAFRAALDDACETIAACGEEEEICETSAARDAAIAEFIDELRTEGVSPECEEVVLTSYADLYSCYSNLTCDQFSEDSGCESRLDEAAIAAACPDIDL
ncbi:MAG: hypothetical protein AB8H86_30740 [Polyangiales bacterium]